MKKVNRRFYQLLPLLQNQILIEIENYGIFSFIQEALINITQIIFIQKVQHKHIKNIMSL